MHGKAKVIKDQFSAFLKIHSERIKEAAKEYGCVYLTFLPYSCEEEVEMTEVNIELGPGEVLTIPFPSEVIGQPESISWRFYLKDFAEIMLEVDIVINGNDWDVLTSSEEPAKLYDFFKKGGFVAMDVAAEALNQESA